MRGHCFGTTATSTMTAIAAAQYDMHVNFQFVTVFVFVFFCVFECFQRLAIVVLVFSIFF